MRIGCRLFKIAKRMAHYIWFQIIYIPAILQQALTQIRH